MEAGHAVGDAQQATEAESLVGRPQRAHAHVDAPQGSGLESAVPGKGDGDGNHGLLLGTGDVPEAEALLRRSLETNMRVFGGSHPTVARS